MPTPPKTRAGTQKLNMSEPLQLPMVHMNGTGIKDLRGGYDEAAGALSDFIDAYGRIEFNARDYYPMGPDAWGKAADARSAINLKLREIREYLDAHREHLYSIDR